MTWLDWTGFALVLVACLRAWTGVVAAYDAFEAMGVHTKRTMRLAGRNLYLRVCAMQFWLGLGIMLMDGPGTGWVVMAWGGGQWAFHRWIERLLGAPWRPLGIGE